MRLKTYNSFFPPLFPTPPLLGMGAVGTHGAAQVSLALGLRAVALPKSGEGSVCQLQARPLESPSLMLGCQRRGGSAAAAPVSDVMLRSSFSAPLPSSVEDAAAIAAEQQRSGSASLAALGAFWRGGGLDPFCKCKVTARL